MTMVNAKLGVNAYGATQTKAEKAGASNLSVQDKEKLGGEYVGEVLNKIVDANWTDPSKKPRVAGNPNLDKDAFFKKEIVQLTLYFKSEYIFTNDKFNFLQGHDAKQNIIATLQIPFC